MVFKKNKLNANRILLLLLSIALALGSAGCDNNAEVNEERSEEQQTQQNIGENVVNENSLVVASNGRCDYVIVYNGKDSNAKRLAAEMATLVYTASGALVKTQDVSVVNKQNKHELIIGNARDCVASAVSTAATEDFVISVVEDDVIFWASNDDMYKRLEKYLANFLITSNPDRILCFEKGSTLFYSKDDIEMNFLTLFKDKKTDYVVVYDPKDEDAAEYVDSFIKSVYGKCGVMLRSKSAIGFSAEREIIVGGARAGVGELVKKNGLNEKDDFGILIDGDDLVLYATDKYSYAYMLEYIMNEIFTKNSGEYFMLATGDDIVHSKTEHGSMSYVEYYQSIYKTYSSQVDFWIERDFKAEDKKDVALVKALVERLGGGFAVMSGSSSALYDGQIVKLDKNDYSKTALISGGSINIPASFAREYFGTGVSADASGYVDITQYCKNNGYNLYTDSVSGISVVMPSDEKAFAPSQSVNGYTDATYISRMKLFFVNPYSPEPQNNTEQSRVEVERNDACFDTEHTLDFNKATFSIYFDPTILSVKDGSGKTVLYCAFGETPYVEGASKTSNLVFKKSEDGGATWEQIAKISGYSVPSMFEHNGYIYIMGGFADVQITRYNISTNQLKSVKLSAIKCGSGGPGTILIHGGRVYKSYADVVISASLDSDLLAVSSWTVSSTVSSLYTTSWKQEVGFVDKVNANPGIDWEEGSVIPGKDGKLYVTYRSNRQIGTMLIYELSKDGKTLSYVTECNGTKLARKSIINTPSSISRPAIHYDETTGLYISLMCLYMGDNTTNYYFTDYLQRAVLGFVVSEDLVNWTVVDTLLVDRMMLGKLESITAHGFQYVDFIIEGNDILFVVRENSGERTIRYCHDAPLVTFYKISDYKKLLRDNNLIKD